MSNIPFPVFTNIREAFEAGFKERTGLKSLSKSFSTRVSEEQYRKLLFHKFSMGSKRFVEEWIKCLDQAAK